MIQRRKVSPVLSWGMGGATLFVVLPALFAVCCYTDKHNCCGWDTQALKALGLGFVLGTLLGVVEHTLKGVKL